MGFSFLVMVIHDLDRSGQVVTWGHADYGGDSSLVQQQLSSVLHMQVTWRVSPTHLYTIYIYICNIYVIYIYIYI